MFWRVTFSFWVEIQEILDELNESRLGPFPPHLEEIRLSNTRALREIVLPAALVTTVWYSSNS